MEEHGIKQGMIKRMSLEVDSHQKSMLGCCTRAHFGRVGRHQRGGGGKRESQSVHTLHTFSPLVFPAAKIICARDYFFLFLKEVTAMSSRRDTAPSSDDDKSAGWNIVEEARRKRGRWW